MRRLIYDRTADKRGIEMKKNADWKATEFSQTSYQRASQPPESCSYGKLS